MHQQIIHEKESLISNRKKIIEIELNKNKIRSLDLASGKEPSSWLNAMPPNQYHLDITKSKFRDSI